MQRVLKGIGKNGFFQKHTPNYFRDWIPTVHVKKVNGCVNHVVCNSRETLLFLVNQYVLMFHVALRKVENIDHPDKFF